MKNCLFLLIFFILSTYSLVFSQSARQLVQVIVTPDKSDWTYAKGDQAQFQIMILKNNVPLEGIEENYHIGPELMDPWEEKTVTFKKGVATIKAKKFNKLGFLRCTAPVEIDEKTYSCYVTAEFSPEQIKPTTTLLSEFEQFWDGAKAELPKIPMKPVLTLIPERCTEKMDIYHASIYNFKGKVYGTSCKPKGEGKYSAILHVPGAGGRPYYGDIWNAEKGIITFQIGIHGISVNLTQSVYDDLRTGGWHHMFKDNFTNKPKKIETSQYYDVMNFTRFVKVLGWYSWGYNDNVCLSTSMYAA